MTGERWERIKLLFDKALELPLEARAAYLDAACGDSVERKTIDDLLKQVDATRFYTLLETPVHGVPVFGGPVFEGNELVAQRFRIVRRIASGGMGEVYEAFDEQLRIRVALKTLRAALVSSRAALVRFQREVWLTREIAHPGICRIFDLVIHREAEAAVPCITMQFLEGQDLATVIENKRPMPLAAALEVVRQICDALDVLHSHGIIHCDLKPSNIMLIPRRDDTQQAVLMDFGLSRHLDVGSSGSTGVAVAEDPLISLPAASGTPYFQAPEVFRGEGETAASDIFSLGLVIDEMVTTSRAFPVESAALYYSKLHGQVTAPSRRSNNLPAVWDRVILKCLAPDPKDRYSSGADVVRGLTASSTNLIPSVLRRIATWTRTPSSETRAETPPQTGGTRPPNRVEYIKGGTHSARPLNEAKLILVGRGEVGKTSVVDRLVHNHFQAQKKTEGIQIIRWSLPLNDLENARLHIWDFGGQEIMHATHQFFLTDRTLYLVVLNGREGGEDADVEYWLKLIESFGGESPVVIVMNKIRSHSFDLNRQALRDKYQGRIRGFIRTDCEDGTGIGELREAIRRETDRLPHLRDSFPAGWFAVKDRLATMKENYVSFDEYRRICGSLGEEDPQAQDILATALHCLGIALNYKDDARLSDTHVLNPHWVTNGIYTILNSEILEANRGELSTTDLRRILKPDMYPQHMHDFLLNLMRKFELCFRFPEPNDDTFLIPQLLDKQQPALGVEFLPAACLNFRYAYPVWPEGLLPRFIVRTRALSARQPRWRSGVVLEFEGNRALVKADPQEKTVLISVTGQQESRRRLLAVIRSDFERIHEDIPKLKPVASVPLPEDPSVAISYDELCIFERDHIETVHRAVAGRTMQVNITRLLNSVQLPASAPMADPVRVFISYSHKDDELRAELDAHLKIFQKVGLIQVWHDRRITPGEDWKSTIDHNLETADLVLLLISSDFISSEYCYDIEMEHALQRHAAGLTRIVPIIVRECVWQPAPFASAQALPRGGVPVRRWPDRDSAWSSVAQDLDQIIRKRR